MRYRACVMSDRTLFIIGSGIWAFISLSLVARIWIIHRRESFGKKLFWASVVLVPFIGWFFYGAFFKPVGDNRVVCPETQGIECL